MRATRVSVLLHRAHGQLHLDVVLGVGSRCPTWNLSRHGAVLRLVRKPDHRRRYLTCSGPVDGRGVVRQVGQGWLWGVPRASGWTLKFAFNELFDKQLRRFIERPNEAIPPADVWLMSGHGERVVHHRLMPRIPRHERLG